MCCIGALIIMNLNSLHHEVVGNKSILSCNPRNLYNTHTFIYTHTLQVHYTTLTPHLPTFIKNSTTLKCPPPQAAAITVSSTGQDLQSIQWRISILPVDAAAVVVVVVVVVVVGESVVSKAQYYYITTGLYYMCVLYRSPHNYYFKFSPSRSGRKYEKTI